ncbi:MAG: hypothetical protein LUG16_06710, partial [Candidatus Gastranaerophilales bacterium]|nr:hypothetical protein [Candidatus Gastranaerophilales bacterium]
MNISSQVLSKLGSAESKIPLAVKDVFNSLGCTYFSYDAGGKVEGADRFIDEFGTCGLWLFGIPAYKKLIDKTVFKKAGISPDVDVRILNNKNYYEAVKKHTKDKKILKEITTAGENLGKTKGLNIAKFAMALGLTMMSFLAMTKGKQFFTRKN